METKEKVMTKETLTLSKQIDIAMIKLDLVQADVVQFLIDEGVPMNTSKFSILKKNNAFSEIELKGLSKVLNTKF